MIFIDHIPLADAQLYKLRGYALKHWGAVRAVAVRVKGDNEMSSHVAGGSNEKSWAIMWLESKDKAALALEGQDEALTANQQHFGSSTVEDHQFHFEKCNWDLVHSKRAITVLSEIWRAVPMAVVSK
eukprot:COSAG06_NODE_30051_length_545_cov_1.910314_1_plen_126_part_10